ncbi:MAG TPA: HAD-IA family hydrolase [Gemmatimonadales bacterium]|jgi:2-haloalkanoic acid dehalogenase type II
MHFDVVTFDCYGTLIDWEDGISAAFARAWGVDQARHREAVLRAYAAVEPQVQAAGFRVYKEVLAETARRVADHLAWDAGPRDWAFLAESLPAWPPFPDTADALRSLHHAGLRLGILSNVDDDLLAGTLRQLPPVFDFLVTAEQIRSYKPAPGHFLACRDVIGSATWLHVAQSWFHDVTPATRLGVPVCWINRKGEERGVGGAPIAEFPTLEGVVDSIVKT